MTEYLGSVREVERRVQKMEAQVGAHPAVPSMPIGVPELYDDHVKLMYDLLALAFQADVTQVGRFMLAHEASTRTDTSACPIRTARSPITETRRTRSRSTPKSILTTSAYSITSSIGCARRLTATAHCSITRSFSTAAASATATCTRTVRCRRCWRAAACGQLAGGRHMRVAADTPMTNLLVSILEKVGVEAESIGDSTGRIADL